MQHIPLGLVITTFSISQISPSLGLINNDWDTLARETTIRYFSPDWYYPSDDPEEIWNKMGGNITCLVEEGEAGLGVSVEVPQGFLADKPFKVFTHGFSSKIIGDGKTEFVNAWMSTTEKSVNVILVDWSGLAKFNGIDDWDNYVYDLAARNSIDVGQFLGVCLGELSNKYGVSGSQLHFSGHSLGSHLMGKAGRTFQSQQLNGELVGRLTGLDPAGPRFVDGPILEAIPELAANILTKESATFVDVIHTNGGFEPCVLCSTDVRCGTILQLGHMDFYPSGGSVQPGCLFGIDARPFGLCSHRRAVYYYLHSIWEPNLFPSMACSTVEQCNMEEVENTEVVAYMGEEVMEYYQGVAMLYYHQVDNCHWTYTDHNNFMCL